VRLALLRIGSLLISLVLASVVVFVVLRLLPGDAAGATLGVGTTTDQLDQLRSELGTDQPVVTQYVQWLGQIVRGDLGTSFVSRLPVADLIAQKLPITVPLSVAAFVLAVLVSVPLGVIAAVHRHGPVGVAVSAVSQLGVAVPVFWVGVLLVLVFALRLGVLPAGGFPRTGWGDPAAAVRALVLPALTLALITAGTFGQILTRGLTDALAEPYADTARAKGLGRTRVVLGHALRNASIPVFTMVGMMVGGILSGAVIVETVYGRAGIGRLFVEAVRGQDFPLIQALIVLSGGLFVVVTLVVDLAYRWIDPRITAPHAKVAA